MAIDAKDGKVAVAGWNEVTTVAALDLARPVTSWGVRADPVHRRGARRHAGGPEPRRASRRSPARAAFASRAAGGISTLDDLVGCARSSRWGWTRSSWARPSTSGASASPRPRRRRPDHARQAPRPLPRRGPRPGGQGRAASSPCATPATPWSARRATTPRAPTSWCSSTSPPPPTRGPSSSTWCGGWRTRCSCPSRWGAACGRVEDADAAAARGGGQGGGEHRRGRRPGAPRAPRASASARRRWCWPSTRGRRGRATRLGGLRARRPHAHRPGRRGLGPRRRRAGRGRDPAHQHGPGRHQGRVRPAPDPRGGRRGQRSRGRLRAAAERWPTWRRCSRRARPARPWPRPSSISARCASPTRKRASCAAAGVEVRP